MCLQLPLLRSCISVWRSCKTDRLCYCVPTSYIVVLTLISCCSSPKFTAGPAMTVVWAFLSSCHATMIWANPCHRHQEHECIRAPCNISFLGATHSHETMKHGGRLRSHQWQPWDEERYTRGLVRLQVFRMPRVRNRSVYLKMWTLCFIQLRLQMVLWWNIQWRTGAVV